MLRRWICHLSRYADRWWYSLLMAGLSAADAYLVIVPNEAILVAAVLIDRRRWLRMSSWMAVGSAAGATSLAWLASIYGNRLIHSLWPSLRDAKTWLDSIRMIHDYGAWGLGLISFSPLPQHAAVIIAGLAHMDALTIFLSVLIGRALKYVLLAWGTARAPHVLRKWRLIPRWMDETQFPCREDRAA